MFVRRSLAVPPLSPLPIVLVLLVVVLLVWWGARSRSTRRTAPRPADNLDTLAAWPPTATRVLTSAEHQVYDLLRTALPAHMVLAQVPLQRFLKVPTRNSYAEWLRRVGHLSADLVVCDRHSQVVAVIEVRAADEVPSDRAQRRQQRLLKVLKAAEIPVHLWSAAHLPSAEAVREAIAPVPPDAEPARGTPTFATRSVPGHLSNQAANDLSADDTAPLREPPPSTWFDDFDSAPTPLGNPQRPGFAPDKERGAD
jgi:hypothetical protein